jgi:hypothetical protein
VTDKTRRLPMVGEEFIGSLEPWEDCTTSEHQARLKIREGLRLVLTGIELLWNLPRSFETKKEQGRR